MSKESTPKWSVVKKLLAGLAILLVVFFAAFYFLLTPQLVKTLEEAVYQETGGVYTLHIEGADINAAELSVQLQGISLAPNAQLTDSVSGVESVVFAKMEQFELSFSNMAALLTQSKVVIDRLNLKNPELIYYVHKSAAEEGESDINVDSTLLNASQYGSLMVKELLLSDGRIEVFQVGTDTQQIAYSDKILFELANFEFNASLKRFVDYSSFRLTLDELAMIDPERFLQLNAQNAVLNSLDSSFVAQELELVPTVERSEFAQKRGFQSMAPDAKVKHLKIEGLSYLNIALHQFAEARKITIDTCELKLFKNHKNDAIGFKQRLLPNTFLKQLANKVEIDSIDIRELAVHIEEQTTDGHFAKMKFTHINGLITNVYNDREKVKEYPKMFVQASGWLGGEAECELFAEFELDHDNDAFSVKGEVDELELKVLNPFVDPMSHVKFTDGFVEELEFKMNADDFYARGKVKLNLSDVAIGIGEKRKGESKGKRILKTIAVSAGNLALQVHQEFSSDAKRKGTIGYHRDREKTVFSYVFRSALSGILSAVGIKVEEEKLHPDYVKK